ncbi:hypothetical protein ADILRU_0887 [Leifsonia rubra CMS 76R]|nr:hypothetical protein ADILRU_0887 [Leifsonia rubra CMS 76R]
MQHARTIPRKVTTPTRMLLGQPSFAVGPRISPSLHWCSVLPD